MRCLLVCLFVLTPVLAIQSDDEGFSDLLLVVGSQEIIPAEGITHASVGNQELARLSRGHKGLNLTIKALKPGHTDLMLHQASGQKTKVALRIVERDPQRIITLLSELLTPMHGLEIRQVDDQVILDGKLLTPSDKKRVSQIAQQLDVMDLTQVHMGRYLEVKSQLLEESIALPSVQVRFTEQNVILEGTVISESSRERIHKLAKAHGMDVIDLLTVKPAMVALDLSFISFEQKELKAQGLNALQSLNGLISGQGHSSGELSALVSAQLPFTLQALRGEDGISILAEPHLQGVADQEMTFQEGGRQGIQHGQKDKGGVTFVDTGLMVSVLPHVLPSHDIELTITVEVVLPQGHDETVVDYSTFRNTTVVRCQSGETVTLSGLSQKLKSRFEKATPLLGDLPILGSLFKHQGQQQSQHQVLLFIKPRILAHSAHAR